jgi:hypothetical protein
MLARITRCTGLRSSKARIEIIRHFWCTLIEIINGGWRTLIETIATVSGDAEPVRDTVVCLTF